MSADEDRALLIAEFQTECRENLEQFELGLLELETDPTSGERLRTLFRCVHTIKGSCSFLDLPRIEATAHAGESLLALARDRSLVIDSEATNALLAMVDSIRRLLAQLAESGDEGEIDVSPVIERLERAARGESASLADAARDDEGDEATGRPLGGADGKIRVDVGLLDRLMNLVGELVLSRNQIAQLTTQAKQTALAGPSQRLSLVTTELQEAVMKTRMQPIGNVWSRFPRIVRDLEQASGKRVRLELEGRDTELDKSIIEAIQDPLVHLVRNAVDHGVEAPEERLAAGKPEQALLRLRAFHEGGMVNIEVIDDGVGIDPDRVKERALERGLVTSDEAARLDERDALALLFLPGFSTASQVTHVSGRGVGMDVVKTNVEKIGGTVDVHSRLGEGTSIRIKIPLTLAIIPALIVRSGGQSYAIPQASLLEVVRIGGDQTDLEIEEVHGAPVFRLRGKLLPLAFLHRELGVESALVDGDSLAIVVLKADERSFGLVVDDVSDTEEIVVKPLWKRLKDINCYAGATVMGDGHVALILDALGLAQRVAGHAEQRETQASPAAMDRLEVARESDQAVLCRMADDGRIAIPLSKVARLEELPATQIEHVGGRDVVQYRGRSRPLVHLSEFLGQPDAVSPEALPDTHHVVVCSHGDRSIGLVVENILDVTEVQADFQGAATRTGVLGSITLHGRITEFLDVDAVIRSADPAFFAARESSPSEALEP